MINQVTIEALDETYAKVEIPKEYLEEYKAHMTWEKEIRRRNFYSKEDVCFYNENTGIIGIGFKARTEQFLESKGIPHKFVEKPHTGHLSGDMAVKTVMSLDLPFTPDDFQQDAVRHAIDEQKTTILGATSSGKSLVISGVSIYAAKNKKRVLIIVPLISLVTQMHENFIEYGAPANIVTPIHNQADDEWKTNITSPIVISTWQSIKNKPQSWFENFDVLICDEVHGFASKKASEIVKRCVKSKWKIGFTGTLPDKDINKAIVESMFGQPYNMVTTKELIDRNRVAIPSIRAIQLQYTEQERAFFTQNKVDYKNEIDWLCAHERRNDFLVRFALSLSGNTILLYRYVQRHGLVVYEQIKRKTNRPVYFISGTTDATIRDQFTGDMETLNDAILVASYGTLSTGISIKNIDNLIMASPVKSRTTTLQSIGRTLRLQTIRIDDFGNEYKNDTAQVFDIGDDLVGNQKPNYSKRHQHDRIGYYHQEQIPYTTEKIFI